MTKEKGTLFLIPAVIADNTKDAAIPQMNVQILNTLTEFIVEEERTARRFLKSVGYELSLNSIKLNILNEHSDLTEAAHFIQPLLDGRNMGLISEAGCPCVADPGSKIVLLCHEHAIPVKPLSGPSSIILALMSSGLNGQNFAFNGYLPIEKNARRKKIKELESRVFKEGQTQIFMEAPYRNNGLLQDLIQVCSPHTQLSIAVEIMSEKEFIFTQPISLWKKKLPELHKKKVIFILGME